MRYRSLLVPVLGMLALASPPSFAADAAHGQSLYNSFCISCHGSPPSGGPELAANNPALIRFALNTIPDMRFLANTINDAAAADIAAYIASLSAPPPPPPPPTSGPVVPAFDFTDLWWNPLESGWGFNIIQHTTTSNNLFCVMYTYDATGHASWYILPGGTWTTPMQFTGPWGRSAGSPASAPYRFGPVTQVGTATINFIDRDNATITFAVDGVSATKTMSRLPF